MGFVLSALSNSQAGFSWREASWESEHSLPFDKRRERAFHLVCLRWDNFKVLFRWDCVDTPQLSSFWGGGDYISHDGQILLCKSPFFPANGQRRKWGSYKSTSKDISRKQQDRRNVSAAMLSASSK